MNKNTNVNVNKNINVNVNQNVNVNVNKSVNVSGGFITAAPAATIRLRWEPRSLRRPWLRLRSSDRGFMRFHPRAAQCM